MQRILDCVATPSTDNTVGMQAIRTFAYQRIVLVLVEVGAFIAATTDSRSDIQRVSVTGKIIAPPTRVRRHIVVPVMHAGCTWCRRSLFLRCQDRLVKLHAP